MPAYNISCTVCKQIFKDSDSIYTTSCGHVFHYCCLSQWKSRSSNCPQCRQYNPATNALYLNFEPIQDYEQIISKLEEKLKNYEDIVNQTTSKLQNKVKKINNLNEAIVEKQKKIDDIQRLYNISEEWRAEFQDKIHNITKENEKLRQNKSLEASIEPRPKEENFGSELTNKTEDEFKQIICQKTEENIILKETVNEFEILKMSLEHKIEMLEQRFKHLTLEFKQEFSKNIKQSTDNLNKPISNRKQSKRNKDKSERSKPGNSKTINISNDNINKSLDFPKHELSDSLTNIAYSGPIKTGNLKASNISNDNLNKNKNPSTKQFQIFKLAQPNESKIFINNFPKSELSDSLINTVLSLASKMNISIYKEDILNVSTLEYKVPTNEIGILVEFKTINAKIEFLSRRHRLKSYSSTKFVQVKEYIDEKVYPIFMYANRNLRSNGYEYVCCKDNKVFAKKSMNDTIEIAIKDKNDVDRLLGRTKFRSRPVQLSKTFNGKPRAVRNYSPAISFDDVFSCESPERPVQLSKRFNGKPRAVRNYSPAISFDDVFSCESPERSSFDYYFDFD